MQKKRPFPRKIMKNRNEFEEKEKIQKNSGRLNPVGVIVPAAVLICGLAAAILKGYLPHVEMETILGVIVIAIAGIMLGLRIIKTKKVFASPGTGVCIRRNSETHRKIRNMPSWNKTEKKTSGKRSGWKEAEGKCQSRNGRTDYMKTCPRQWREISKQIRVSR